MTTQEYTRQLNSKISKLKTGLPIGIAAQDTHVKMVERIFEKGENAEGSGIGKYNSTDPLYVNPNDSPKKFPTKGKPSKDKPGKTKFKNGESHKTGYFESYKAFREKVGRETDHVNLNLFGNLQNDFGKGVIKLSNEAYISRVSQGDNLDKIKGAEGRYGDVFKLTKVEREHFKDVLEFETMRILK